MFTLIIILIQLLTAALIEIAIRKAQKSLIVLHGTHITLIIKPAFVTFIQSITVKRSMDYKYALAEDIRNGTVYKSAEAIHRHIDTSKNRHINTSPATYSALYSYQIYRQP